MTHYCPENPDFIMNFHINEVGEKCFVDSLLSPTASNQRVHVIFSYVLVAKGCPPGYTHL